MITKKRVIIALTVVLLLASAGLAAAVMIPSAEELLVQSLETLETVEDGHALVEMTANLPDQSLSGSFEVWGQLNPDGPPSLRLEVIEASEAGMAGATFVSNGSEFWLYHPEHNTVVVGTAEELGPLLAEKMAEYGDHMGDYGAFDPESAEHPQTPAEAVAKLLEYVTAERKGQEQVGETNAYLLRLVPIAEMMPDEVRAAGGYINLWLRATDQLPLAAEYDKSTLGDNVYGKVEATMVDINTGLNPATFTFDIPDGVEVVQAVDLAAEMEAKADSTEAVDFEPLVAAELPDGAVPAPVQEFGGAVIQRYNLADGESFVVAQGAAMPLDPPAEATKTESVTVRGVDGTLYTNDDGSRTLLAWQEGGYYFIVGGDVSPDQALSVAESLQ